MQLLIQILLQFCTVAVLLPTTTTGYCIVTHFMHMPGYFGCSLNNYTPSCIFPSYTWHAIKKKIYKYIRITV